MDDQMNNNGPVQYQPTQMPEGNDKDGYAVAILVLGILSIVCCAPCGIVALILRANSKNEISAEKQGLVTAGFVTSIIGICIWAIAIIYYIFVAAFAISTFSMF